MPKCKLINCWAAPYKHARIEIHSPKGGRLIIRRLDCDLLLEDEWALIRKCLNSFTDVINLSVMEMWRLRAATVRCNGVVVDAKEKTAPQNVSKAKPQKSFAQRKFERMKREQSNNQKITGGCCPNCNSSKLKVKRHDGWIGYYCGSCKGGGSLTLKK